MKALFVMLIFCLSGVFGICTIDESKCILEQIKTKIWLMEQLISKESETCHAKQTVTTTIPERTKTTEMYNTTTLATTTTEKQVICDEGWQKFNEHCYYLSLERATWNDALDKCMEFGGSLTSITSAEENDFIKTLARTAFPPSRVFNIFIGGMLVGNDKPNWRWVSTFNKLTFTDWGPGEPHQSRLDEKCMGVASQLGNRWNDLNCAYKGEFICKK